MDAEMEKMKFRQNYRNHWHTDLLRAPQSDPLFCCFSLWCGPCASYILRKRALYNDMSRYTCCGGYMPCSGRCGESHCPELCLCTEQVACIFSCIACITGNDELQEASRVLNCCSDMVYCTVCSCMQTQHKVEMNKRDGKFGARPTTAPPVQHMSRLDQPLPPTIAYAVPQHPQTYPPPPQQPYGYPPPQQQPPMYPPPPLQNHGYPPPNYAPSSGVGYPPPGYPQ